jgi:hypothetical protein
MFKYAGKLANDTYTFANSTQKYKYPLSLIQLIISNQQQLDCDWFY